MSKPYPSQVAERQPEYADGAGAAIGGITRFASKLAREVALRQTEFGGNYESKPLRQTVVRPFTDRIVSEKLQYGSGCVIGTEVTQGNIVSFDLRAGGRGTDYRIRAAQTPDRWNPSKGGGTLRNAGVPDKYVLAIIPIDANGDTVPGNDWRLVYAGASFDEIGVSPEMPVSRIEERSAAYMAELAAAQPGVQHSRFEIKGAFPRDPAKPTLLFPDGAIVENVVGYR
jgi:hypothetical protein